MSRPEIAGDLRPAPYNPREITEHRLSLLEGSMTEFGDLSGIVFNRATGRLVGGHQRLKKIPPEAYIHRTEDYDPPTDVGTVAHGFIEYRGERWAYREVDWPVEIEKLANIAANKHGGEFDLPVVRDILDELDTGVLDLTLSGFDEGELERLMAPVHNDDPESADEHTTRGVSTITCPDCGKEFER